MASAEGTMMQREAAAARQRAADQGTPMAIEDAQKEGTKRTAEHIVADGDSQQHQRPAPALTTPVAAATAAAAEAVRQLDPTAHWVQL